MKTSVIKAYTDRETSVVHLVGEVVELTDARAKELAANGFVKPHSAPKTATKSKTTTTKAATTRKGR